MPQSALMAELKTICRRACQPRAALPRDEAHHRAGLASTVDPVSRFVCCPLASEVAGWLLLTEQPQPQHATRTVPRGEYRRPAATHKMQWAIGMSTASQHNITLTADGSHQGSLLCHNLLPCPMAQIDRPPKVARLQDSS